MPKRRKLETQLARARGLPTGQEKFQKNTMKITTAEKNSGLNMCVFQSHQ